MKINCTLQLKNQAEVNALIEIVSFFINANPVPLLTADIIAHDILEGLEKFKEST